MIELGIVQSYEKRGGQMRGSLRLVEPSGEQTSISLSFFYERGRFIELIDGEWQFNRRIRKNHRKSERVNDPKVGERILFVRVPGRHHSLPKIKYWAICPDTYPFPEVKENTQIINGASQSKQTQGRSLPSAQGGQRGAYSMGYIT